LPDRRRKVSFVSCQPGGWPRRRSIIATTETLRADFGVWQKQAAPRKRPMERTRGDGSDQDKETVMMISKTHAAAALAFALLTVPAFAGGTPNGKSLNGLKHNSLTSNSLTSNAIFANGTGIHALNGVHVDGIVLVKSTSPVGKSVVNSNERNLPAVQHGTIEKPVIDPNFCGLPLDMMDPSLCDLPAVQQDIHF
jgi:hypothetical protein